ncbi:metal-dependent hydrolase family protein [Actinoplanes couchii]|uniref:Peptidase M38 n=1 Tax=Actinoplanes couchii TaxID=403638 RepID=A0ABQ3XLF6_9ACTN|nr:amidohydrolase family protein [Actinoplanes couchii]MDR6318320.1 imidazolonepropionase-like amidohydrolase [Actinoplanes couchii]GID59311.1 peptidase M38 [Actinoplanes couchii]
MSGGDLIVRNARIFDGHTEELTEGSIRIVDGVVREIGDVATGAGVRTVDARGAVVTPGLIDAHFHAYAISLESGPIEKAPRSYVALRAQHRLRDALHRGFTTVRDPAGGDAGLARAIDEGVIVSPRYFFTGAALSQTGGHGDYRGAGDDSACHDGCAVEVVDGVEALRVAVRDRFRHGAHAIKLMTSGGVVSPVDPIAVPQYSAAEITAVTDEARRRGSYVAAHAYSPEAIVHSVVNGVRSIEHGNLLDAPTARLMAEHDAVLVPTLGAYDAMDRLGAQLGLSEVAQQKNREVLHAGGDAVRYALEAGVTVGFGSDNMGDLVSEQLVGVRLIKEAVGALAALRAVTGGNSTLLGRDDLGRLAIGTAGDLVVWSGDPFTDIDVIADRDRDRTVIQNGLVVR